jgi:hypothetical protein
MSFVCKFLENGDIGKGIEGMATIGKFLDMNEKCEMDELQVWFVWSYLAACTAQLCVFKSSHCLCPCLVKHTLVLVCPSGFSDPKNMGPGSTLIVTICLSI